MPDNFNRMVILDTETTGMDPQRHQVLTIDALYARSVDGLNWTAEGEPFSAKVEKMRWSAVDERAMQVNGIRLSEWSGDTEAEVVSRLTRWVRERAGDGYILLCGYNVSFDKAFMEAMYERSKMRWTEAFSYRSLCVLHLVQWMKLAGFLPATPRDSMKLEEVAKALAVHKAGAHTSAVDIQMTLAVMNQLLGVMAQGSLFKREGVADEA